MPPTAGEGDPTDGHNAGAVVAGVGQPIQGDPAVIVGHTTDFDAAIGHVHPGILIRRKLVGRQNDVVARPPGEAFGHQADAGRGVGNQGDFVRLRPDQGRRPAAELLDLVHPAAVVGGRAVGRGVLAPTGQRLLGRTAQRRHRRMVEIRPTVGDRHLATKLLPVGGTKRSRIGQFSHSRDPQSVACKPGKPSPLALQSAVRRGSRVWVALSATCDYTKSD